MSQLPPFWASPQCDLAMQPIVALTASFPIRCAEVLVRPRVNGVSVPGVLDELNQSGQMEHFTLALIDWAANSVRRLSVNVPPDILCRGSFVQELELLASRHAHLPFIEVIEDPVDDEAALISNLFRLRALGFRIAFDDYADTDAHRARLGAIPWNRVKLDRSLLKDRQALTKAVRRCSAVTTELAIEGVESHTDLETITAIGDIPLAQGYLFGRPEVVIDISGPAVHRIAKTFENAVSPI